MNDRPTAGELAAAVAGFLESEILPTLDDRRLRFRTLVAINALSIVERESPPAQERDWEVARRLRAGDVRPGDLEDLKREVEAKLRIASPGYLESVGEPMVPPRAPSFSAPQRSADAGLPPGKARLRPKARNLLTGDPNQNPNQAPTEP